MRTEGLIDYKRFSDIRYRFEALNEIGYEDVIWLICAIRELEQENVRLSQDKVKSDGRLTTGSCASE